MWLPATPGVDLGDPAIRHQLGLLQHALDRPHRGLDVDDHALAQPARRLGAEPDDVEAAVGTDLGDDRDDLRRADVEADDHVLVSFTIALPSPRTRARARMRPCRGFGLCVSCAPAEPARPSHVSCRRLLRRPLPEAGDAGGEAVAIAQVHLLDARSAARERADRALVHGDEMREPRGRVVAPELDRQRPGGAPRDRGASRRAARGGCSPPRARAARARRPIRDSAPSPRARVPRARRTAAAPRCSRRRTPRRACSTSPASAQRANGTCSSTVTSSRCGHCRRSATLRTHGTRASEARARSRSIVKNVPASSSRTTASRWAALTRSRGSRTTTSRNANEGCRATHASAPQSRSAPAISARPAAIAFSCLASSHMRAPQDFDAEIAEAHPGLPRRHRHQRMAGHPRRRVHFEEDERPVGP